MTAMRFKSHFYVMKTFIIAEREWLVTKMNYYKDRT